ncbi:hypothetical protein OS493_026063 [Desmophyllum pertusum]|uniref:Uncharacterized protein n=1 Tax=Desmophyllum pertusum TaxID=174260 RepID=A0A9X0CF46_9CNID|nr:hypothetical protein OS493_026063 [Desmophyllum pertusum]
MMEFDADGCAMKEIQELIERFESLQKNITEKREFFHRVTGKWHKFAEQKHKMNSFFKNTQGIVTKRQVKNADDCKSKLKSASCEWSTRKWNQAKFKVGVKQQALEQVANEFEVLEKDKQEIQQWISDVKKELSTTADEEDQNPEVVVRRRKLKNEVASREKQLKRLSLQALKLVEDFSDNVEVDVSESFQPFFQEWGSVQELAGIPLGRTTKGDTGETQTTSVRPAAVQRSRR